MTSFQDKIQHALLYLLSPFLLVVAPSVLAPKFQSIPVVVCLYTSVLITVYTPDQYLALFQLASWVISGVILCVEYFAILSVVVKFGGIMMISVYIMFAAARATHGVIAKA